MEHYQEESKIRELITLGNISVLDKNIGTKLPSDDYLKRNQLRAKNEQVLSYGRDCNEQDCEADNHSDIWPDTGLYQYLWEDGVWKFSYMGSRSPIDWKELTKDLVTED